LDGSAVLVRSGAGALAVLVSAFDFLLRCGRLKVSCCRLGVNNGLFRGSKIKRNVLFVQDPGTYRLKAGLQAVKRGKLFIAPAQRPGQKVLKFAKLNNAPGGGR
jgi:hypothetical protein